MAASLFVPPRGGAAFVDGNGHTYPGSKLNFYTTGTTTPLDTYTTSALSVTNTNPVVADSNGLFASIYLTANTLYKVVFTTSAGVTVWTTDPVEGVPLTTTPAVGLLRSYLAGLTLSRNSGTPNTKIDVAAGSCADDTNTLGLIVSAGTVDFGTVGANGLDTGVQILSTWYHIYAIGKVDGTTALLGSTSASSPTMPSGYTLKRRIGSVFSDASVHFTSFTQDGDLFEWTTMNATVNSNNPGISAVLQTMAVPPGVNVIANFLACIQNTNLTSPLYALFSDPITTDSTPAVGSSDVGRTYGGTGGSFETAANMSVRTDTSRRVRSRVSFSDAGTQLVMFTRSWIDRRGRDS